MSNIGGHVCLINHRNPFGGSLIGSKESGILNPHSSTRTLLNGPEPYLFMLSTCDGSTLSAVALNLCAAAATLSGQVLCIHRVV